MKKVKTFIRRFRSGSMRRMNRNIEIVHLESGKSRPSIFLDMTSCMLFHGFGYLDYLTFGFAYIGWDKRKTFMTMDDNISLVRSLNDRECYALFSNKLLFNARFGAFLDREYLNLTDGYPAFEAFLDRRPTFICKPAEAFGGAGIGKIYTDGATDRRALYQDLLRGNTPLVEELIVQHPEMGRLCEKSVNTLRIVTVIANDGAPRFVYALLRVGDGKSNVDNISSGGMYTLLDENGTIVYPMFCDKTVTYYETHPQTGVTFAGFTVPFYRESVDLCLRAALVEPRMRYIGWDVAVTEHGPVLIEGNHLPGYDMCQNHRFHPDGMGMKARFQAAVRGADGGRL